MFCSPAVSGRNAAVLVLVWGSGRANRSPKLFEYLGLKPLIKAGPFYLAKLSLVVDSSLMRRDLQ